VNGSRGPPYGAGAAEAPSEKVEAGKADEVDDEVRLKQTSNYKSFSKRVLTLQRERFYGIVELKFLDGGLVLVLEHRSCKLHELRPLNRKAADGSFL
jgi:hypothetical protein